VARNRLQLPEVRKRRGGVQTGMELRVCPDLSAEANPVSVPVVDKLRPRQTQWRNAPNLHRRERCSAATIIQSDREHHRRTTNPSIKEWLDSGNGTRAPGVLGSVLPRAIGKVDKRYFARELVTDNPRPQR
jgi:hypothetical protein